MSDLHKKKFTLRRVSTHYGQSVMVLWLQVQTSKQNLADLTIHPLESIIKLHKSTIRGINILDNRAYFRFRILTVPWLDDTFGLSHCQGFAPSYKSLISLSHKQIFEEVGLFSSDNISDIVMRSLEY